MSVQFIIGRAGSGKTAHFLRQTVAACEAEPLGPPILWLVPRQSTFQTQRDLCCGWGLGGYFRVRVLSLELLCREVLAEMGGATGSDVTALGRNMVLGRLLRQHESRLRFFRTNTTGLAGEIGSAIDEFERGGAEMSGLSDALPSEFAGTALADKLADLELIHGAYNQFLGKQRFDPDRRLRQAMQYFGASPLLRGATIYVDGFLHFTQRERLLLTSLAKACPIMQVALMLDPQSVVLRDEPGEIEEMSLFHQMEEEYCKLSSAFAAAAVSVSKPVLLREIHRFQIEGLKCVEHWGGPHPSPPPEYQGRGNSCGAIRLIEAPDKRAEVEIAARQVRDWAAGGMRFRDIAVFSRQLSDYHDLINAVFGEHDIPFFVDQRRSAGHHPLIQLVQAALTLACDAWQADAMMAVIKSGLCGLTSDEADELENYCLLHGISGKAWSEAKPWAAGRSVGMDEDDEFLNVSSRSADKLRRKLVDALSPFLNTAAKTGSSLSPSPGALGEGRGEDSSPGQTLFAKGKGPSPYPSPRVPGEGTRGIRAHELTQSLVAMLEAFGVRQTLAKWINECKAAGQSEQAEEHEQVWMEFVSVCDQLVDLLGDELMTMTDFRATLLTALEQLDLAIAPATVDQVLVGQVDRTRPPAVKAAIILGLSNGQFPMRPPPNTIITDGDRRALVEIAEMSPDSRRQGMDEEFLGYFAFTRASAALRVTRPAADDAGRVLPAGSLWEKLVRILGAEAVTVVPRRDRRDAAEVSTPRQLIGGLMQWARQDGAEFGKADADLTHERGTPAPTLPLNTGRGGSRDERPVEPGSAPGGADGWASLYQWFIGGHGKMESLQRLSKLAWPALSYANDANLSSATAARLFPLPILASARQLESFSACQFQHFARYGLGLSPRQELGVAVQDISRICRDVLDRLLKQLLAEGRTWRELRPGEVEAMLGDLILPAAARVEGELALSTARNEYLLERIAKALAMVIAGEQALQGDFRPASALWRYGEGKAAAALKIGEELLISGQIDRVDLSPDESLAAIHEYRMNARTVPADEVYYGLSLKLFADLLAWRQNQPESRVVAGLCSPLMRPIKENAAPQDAPRPDSREFAMQYKPRGFATGELPGSMQDAISRTDKIEADALEILMNHVETILSRLGRQIAAGQIEIRPYKLQNKTPCSYCAYNDVCRFESRGGYERRLQTMKRDEVLQRISEKGES